MTIKKKIGQLVFVLVLMITADLHLIGPNHTASSMQPTEPPVSSTQTNLLANGNMDQSSFYWRPTNHFVANMWYEWFWNTNLPEFIDGGHPHHNQCYPIPTSGNCAENNQHSQGYIRYGGPYVAGIYQPVPVKLCTYYKFEAYNRNDEANYHPKVGIDPTGQGLPAYDPYPGNSPRNCPPDGFSECPNPGLSDPSELPSHIIWSPEFEHAAFTWAGQSVVAEALSTTITVWTYVAPDATGSPSRSTYWDNASLVEVPPSNGMLVASGPLTSTGGITNVAIGSLLGKASLKWQTSQQSLSQVLYHYVGSASSSTLPAIATDTSQYEVKTDINSAARTDHAFELQNLTLGAVYDVALLSRSWAGNQCQTSVHLARFQTSDTLATVGPLPAPDGRISQVESSIVFNAATLQWQAPETAYSQALYHYVGSASATNLPPIANNTQQFELKTGVKSDAGDQHHVRLPELSALSVYDVALLACQLVNDQCNTSVYTLRIKTTDLVIPTNNIPAASDDITGPTILPFDQSAYVIWQSAQPSHSQVFYTYNGPVTSTIHFTPTARVYLPLVANTDTHQRTISEYTFKTQPGDTASTLHIVHLTGLITNSRYMAVAVSGWGEGGYNQVAASGQTGFYTRYTPGTALPPSSPDQLAQQLGDCLAEGKAVARCVEDAGWSPSGQ